MNDHMESAMSHVVQLEPDQLRALIAHAAGLHADKEGGIVTVEALRRIIDRTEIGNSFERMSAVAWRVAHKYNLTLDELKANTKSFDISHVRQEAMHQIRLIKRLDGKARYSLPRIAMFFGLKDHTTVLKGIRRHIQREASKPEREVA